MPRRDGTGSEGKGPRTGRGMGPCVTKDSADSLPIGAGTGAGRGIGRRGRRP